MSRGDRSYIMRSIRYIISKIDPTFWYQLAMSAVGVGRHCWWTPGHPLPSLHFNPSFCYKKLMSRLFLMHSSVFLYPRHFLTLFPCLECSTFLCPDKNLMTSNQTSSTFPESMIILVLLVWKKKKRKKAKNMFPEHMLELLQFRT